MATGSAGKTWAPAQQAGTSQSSAGAVKQKICIPAAPQLGEQGQDWVSALCRPDVPAGMQCQASLLTQLVQSSSKTGWPYVHSDHLYAWNHHDELAAATVRELI